MIARLRCNLVVGIVGAATLSAVPQQADAYPIDCAILLCLAGGWPSNPHCGAARAEFIRRITPWPVEPPLQIWRCPMGGHGGGLPLAALPTSPTDPSDGEPTPSADIDISGPAFDPVRSITVYHMQYTQRTTGGGDMGAECQRRDTSRVGVYGPQGEYTWHERPASSVPSGPGLSAFDPPSNCRSYRYRAVAVRWTDTQGNTGFEEVHY